MRRAGIVILLFGIIASFNGHAFEADCNQSSNPNASGEWVDASEKIGVETEFKTPQKKRSKKSSTQRPEGGVPGGVGDDRPLPLSQTLPNLLRKDEEIEKDAIKRVVPVYPPRDKARYATDSLDVEVVVDEGGNVIAAEPLSGHPLQDAAIEAARQWKFKPALRAGRPVKVAGILVFRVADGAEGPEGEQEKTWQARLKSYRELTAKRSPDNKKLAMAMANLASAAIDAERFAEALQLFKDEEQQKRLPAEAKPYYADLFYYKFDYDRSSKGEGNTNDLQRALDLSVQAYQEESQKKSVDSGLLFDIGGNIYHLLGILDKPEEKAAWLNKMLALPALTDRNRAEISYTLGVGYWQKAYELSRPYTAKKQRVPDAVIERMRPEITRGFEYMFKANSLDPNFPEPYLYENLLWVEEDKIERDPRRKKDLAAKERQALERYQALMKRHIEEQTQSERLQTTNAAEPVRKPYASGLPWLKSPGLAPPPVPPPPPPPSPPPAARGRLSPPKPTGAAM